jgi:hypothetical protein
MSDFKWRHFQDDVILWAVRWYCRYGVSYRGVESEKVMGCSAGCSLYESGVIRLSDADFQHAPTRGGRVQTCRKRWSLGRQSSGRGVPTGSTAKEVALHDHCFQIIS